MYQKTLLGTVLSISCLLKTPGVVENHAYFSNPSRASPQEIKVQEANVHQVGLRAVSSSPAAQTKEAGAELAAWPPGEADGAAGLRRGPGLPSIGALA